MARPHIPKQLRRLVIERARECCEYCLIPQLPDSARHQIDHLISLKHGGLTVIENLALACLYCNLLKGSDIAAFDPVQNIIVPLFNPRTQDWRDHFQLAGAYIIGLTPTGRATVELLRLNDDERLIDRQALIDAGLYPPSHLR
jgi:hypothetical protein